MISKSKGRVVLCMLLYWAATSGLAYVIHQQHEPSRRPDVKSINALRALGAQVHQRRDGSVKYVDLFGCDKIDEAIPHVAELPELEMLTLSGTDVTDEQLGVLAKLPDLQQLAINDTQVTDEGLKHLAKIDKLILLNLDDCPKFTDAGVKYIANHVLLERLHMNHTRITNGCVDHLLKMKNLRFFFAYDTKVDQNGADRVKAVAPNVRVTISE